MKQSKDPFEAAFEEQEESPPESPIDPNDVETQTPAASFALNQEGGDGQELITHQDRSLTSAALTGSAKMGLPNNMNKEDDEEDEEENMDMELKLPSGGDPDKIQKMQSFSLVLVCSTFSIITPDQMRYELFRRSVFKKPNMKRLLMSITGSQKISAPMTITMAGIAKMFVGDLIEKAQTIMTERDDSGPIRPCHIREAYRRLKIEGKIPRKSASRLFR